VCEGAQTNLSNIAVKYSRDKLMEMQDRSFFESTTPQSEPLRFSTKLAYGLGEIARSATATLHNFFLLFFLTNAAGLNPTLAGTILLISNIWDVINRPLIGWLSDRTRSRWGRRRRSWMIVSAVPFGIFFLLTWVVPGFSQDNHLNQNALFWYYATVIFLFNTAFMAIALPHSALAPELTQNYDERTSLISFQSAFSVGSSILSLVLAQAIFTSVTNSRAKYLFLGSVCAVISVVAIYGCVWGTRRRTTTKPEPDSQQANSAALSFRSQLRLVFTNRPFLYVMGIYICSWLTMQMTGALLPYAIVDEMRLSDKAVTQVAIVSQVTSLLMMIVWNALRQRVGKRAIYLMGIPFWLVAQVGIAFLQPGQIGWIYWLAVMSGVGGSAALLVPWSMLPDVIDLDELNSGQRREGIFYGFVGQFQQIALAIALFLIGKSLDWSGFVPTVAGQPTPTQPDAAIFAIRLLFGFVPAAVLFAGMVLAYFYPITRESTQKFSSSLESERSSHNPPASCDG